MATITDHESLVNVKEGYTLLNCTRLTINGDIRFGRNVVLEGDVLLSSNGAGPVHIGDGECIIGERQRILEHH